MRTNMIRLTATTPAFYEGHRIRTGQHFDFDDSRHQLPKWAVPYGTYVSPEPATADTKPQVTLEAVREKAESWGRASRGDTKPLDAQLASYAKTGTRPSDPVEAVGFF